MDGERSYMGGKQVTKEWERTQKNRANEFDDKEKEKNRVTGWCPSVNRFWPPIKKEFEVLAYSAQKWLTLFVGKIWEEKQSTVGHTAKAN